MKSFVLFALIFSSIIYLHSCSDNPVTPEDNTPGVLIISPVNNSNVADSATIIVQVNNIDVKRVELFLDHYLVQDAVFQEPPYEYFWDCRWYQEGSQHILQSKAYNQSGKVTESDYVIINIYRFMPSGLSAGILSDSVIVLNWVDNCKYETGFEVEFAIDDSNFTKIADLDSNTTSYTYRGKFEPERKYLFKVRAVTDDEFSGYSNIAAAEIILQEPINTIINLISDTSIILTWTDNNIFEKGYVISKDYGSGYFIPILTLPQNSTSAEISDIIYVNQYYRYAVHAIRDYYTSQRALFPYIPLQFPAPSSVDFESLSISSVKIKWQDNSTFEKGFIIYRTNGYDPLYEIGRVGENTEEYVDNNIDTSISYTYYIRAYSAYNLSEMSYPLKIFYSPFVSLNKQIQVPAGISEAIVSDDFSIVAMGGYLSGSVCVRVFDMNTGTLLKTLPGRFNVDQIFERMAISPDNKYVAAVGDYYTVTIWDVNTGQVYKYLNIGTSPDFVKFSRDGKSLIVERANSIRIYNINDWSYTSLLTASDDIYAAAIDKDERHIALASYNSNIKVYDYQTGILKLDIPNSGLAGGLQFDQSGRRLHFYSSGQFKTWDIESNILINIISDFGYPVYMGVSPDEKLTLYTGQNHAALELWNIPESKKIGSFYNSLNFAQIRFSPDNKRLFTREFYRGYYLWDIVYKWIQEISS